MHPKWKSKFQLKPGKWVFEPTDESIRIGHEIKSAIEKAWTPPEYFFHLRSGGHVGAIRAHLTSNFFLRVDIQNFFGSINKGRVTRCINKLFNYKKSRDWACASTVASQTGDRQTMLPFGFVQSQIISAVCLHQSRLGRCIDDLKNQNALNVSVYVDDIIISSKDQQSCEDALLKITAAATRSNFFINTEKLEGPAEAITAFNIVLSNQHMRINDTRMDEFENSLKASLNEREKAGVISYVTSINTAQAEKLKLLLDPKTAQRQ